MSKLLSRADLLAVKLPHVDVVVPEMGEGVIVRLQQMSVDTRAKFLERIRLHQNDVLDYENDQDLPPNERKGHPKPADLDTAVLAVVNSIVDENGDKMFSEQDMPLFNSWSSNAVTRIYKATIALNDYDRFASEAVNSEKKD